MAEEFKNSFGSSTSIMEKVKKAQEEKAKKEAEEKARMEAEEKLRAEQAEKERLAKEAERIRAEKEQKEREEAEELRRQEENERQRQAELEAKEREKQHQIELENAWKRKHPVQAFMERVANEMDKTSLLIVQNALDRKENITPIARANAIFNKNKNIANMARAFYICDIVFMILITVIGVILKVKRSEMSDLFLNVIFPLIMFIFNMFIGCSISVLRNDGREIRKKWMNFSFICLSVVIILNLFHLGPAFILIPSIIAVTKMYKASL